MMDWTNILSSIGTFAAVLVALSVAIFGPRRVTKPKLSVTIESGAPDCMWVSGNEKRMRDTGSGPGHYIVRPRVVNYGNEDARDVEVLPIRLWVIRDDGERLIDPSFLPLVQRWSWWPERSVSAAWLPRLLPGTSKHYDLLVIASEQGPRSRRKQRRHSEAAGWPKSWIAFQTAYDLLDDDSVQNRMRKQPGQYQLDFAVAASNAKTIYRTAHIRFNGWQDNEIKMMFGEGGGLHIEITETSEGYANGTPQRRPKYPNSERALTGRRFAGVARMRR